MAFLEVAVGVQQVAFVAMALIRFGLDSLFNLRNSFFLDLLVRFHLLHQLGVFFRVDDFKQFVILGQMDDFPTLLE